MKLPFLIQLKVIFEFTSATPKKMYLSHSGEWMQVAFSLSHSSTFTCTTPVKPYKFLSFSRSGSSKIFLGVRSFFFNQELSQIWALFFIIKINQLEFEQTHLLLCPKKSNWSSKVNSKVIDIFYENSSGKKIRNEMWLKTWMQKNNYYWGPRRKRKRLAEITCTTNCFITKIIIITNL
jgi:hypothetical protein